MSIAIRHTHRVPRGLVNWIMLSPHPPGFPSIHRYFGDSIIKPFVTNIVGCRTRWKRFNEKPATVMTASVYIRRIILKGKNCSSKLGPIQFISVWCNMYYHYHIKSVVPKLLRPSEKVSFNVCKRYILQQYHTIVLLYQQYYLAELFFPQVWSTYYHYIISGRTLGIFQRNTLC